MKKGFCPTGHDYYCPECGEFVEGTEIGSFEYNSFWVCELCGWRDLWTTDDLENYLKETMADYSATDKGSTATK